MYQTVARARLHIKIVKPSIESRICTSKSKTMACSEHFWQMMLAKCARDCSESSICISKNLLCISKLQKTEGIGTLLEDEAGKMRTRL